MNTKLIMRILISIGLLVTTMNFAYALDEVPDKFKIALGGYSIFRADSAISLTEPNLGAGISIDPTTALGLDTEQSVARLDGRYRFNNRHSLTFSWYSINSTANKTLENEISWVDEGGTEIVIPVGASVASDFGYDIFKVGYLWSFYSTEKVELAIGGGLHITRIGLSLAAETVASGLIETSDVDVTVPLPVLSYGLKYQVNPRFSWYIKSEVFAIAFKDWEGTYTDNTLGLEYRFWKHIGLGVGLGSNALRITEEADKYKFRYDNRLSGVMFFLSGYFGSL